MSKLIADFNVVRAQAVPPKPPLQTNLKLVQLRGVTLRNENRFLDLGTVHSDVRVRSLTAAPVAQPAAS